VRISPYLVFDADCGDAFKFYQACLGGKLYVMTFGESPMASETPADKHGLVMHANLELDDGALMGSDAPDGRYEQPVGTCVSIHVDSVDEAERLYKSLSVGGTVQMELQETFWADRFGMFIDRFGTPWMINCGKPDVT